MSGNKKYRVPMRMQKPLEYAMSQPRRETSEFKVDPNWQNKIASNQRKQVASGLVAPPKASSTFGGGMGYSQRPQATNYASSRNQSGSLGGKKSAGFDKQAFLQAQQRGDFRKKNNGQLGQKLANDGAVRFPGTSMAGRNQTGRGANRSGFDIERFKAQQPRTVVGEQNQDSAVRREPPVQRSERQLELLEVQRMQQEKSTPQRIRAQRCSHQFEDELASTLRLRDIKSNGMHVLQCIICKASTVQPSETARNSAAVAEALMKQKQFQEERPSTEENASLPWAGAARNVASRASASKTANSKDFLQKYEQMRSKKQQSAPQQTEAGEEAAEQRDEPTSDANEQA